MRITESSHMDVWKPGQPVLTAQDHADWLTWRDERKRQQQRDRRARYPRIDHYPDKHADELIRCLSGPFVGGDFSSIINRIVGDWASHRHRNIPTRKKCAPTALPPE
jgi:hypothetical protein